MSARSDGGETRGRRLLLLCTTTGYQTRAFAEAAAGLGVEVVYGTDRCKVLEVPWGDGALALAGLWHSPVWLALGYALHGALDFLHHGLRLGAGAGACFPWPCLSFDGIVALFVLYHWGWPRIDSGNQRERAKL